MSGDAVGWLLLAGAGTAAWQAVSRRVYPMRVCPRCGGKGELASGRNVRVCPRCSGTKRVPRGIGRRA